MKNILFRYLARSYLAYFGIGFSILVSALLISNIFDTLNRFRSTSFSASLFLQLISCKLPYLSLEILPLLCFISTLFFLRSIVKSGEFISILNSGVSIWTVLLPMTLSSFCIGIIAITIFNPVSSTLLNNYEKIAAALEKKPHNIAISNFGVMVAENYHGDRRIFTAKTIDIETNKISSLTILFTDQNNNFISRVDAEYAILERGILTLHKAQSLTNKSVEMRMPTNLSMSHFTQNALAPEYISLWQLPNMILTIQKAGMSVSKYQLYYYKQLFKPLTMVATILMATCFMQRSGERVSGTKLLITGIISGFAVYLLPEICVAMLTHQGIKPILAILVSTLCIMIFGILMILHLHETR
jgi:lipopolysaccharide export system permease protein